MPALIPEEIRLSIHNIELAALHWPAQSNLRILALHGWLDNAQSFAPLAEKMPGYDIVALDFPGHGHSEHRPAAQILHYIDYIADVYAVIQALRWDSCVLMGHSMGAGVASIFASAFPERVCGLICLDGLGPVTGRVEELAPRLNKSVRQYLNPKPRPKTVYRSIEQVIDARCQAGDLNRESARRLVSRNLLAVKDGYILRSDARLRLPSLYYLSEEQARAYLSEIDIPTLMIRPQGSVYKVQKVLRARAALIKYLTWVEIPGGHHAHMDQVNELLTPIKHFIDEKLSMV